MSEKKLSTKDKNRVYREFKEYYDAPYERRLHQKTIVMILNVKLGVTKSLRTYKRIYEEVKVSKHKDK